MITAMLDHRMDRHAFIIAVGGGAVLDAAGFAASLVHRGLRIIRVPTTVLSQNDGGVGVKTGRVLLRFGHGNYVPVSGNGMRLLFHGYSRLYAVEPKAVIRTTTSIHRKRHSRHVRK